ncbi:MAG: hypothetical protein HC828_20270 [Blastochloris sp.]|nr:hypothetical protein [Blastochloris sp.]
MSNLATYWKFIRIDAGGNLRSEELALAKAFIQRLFADSIEYGGTKAEMTSDLTDSEIQTKLVQIWHSPPDSQFTAPQILSSPLPDSQLAELCLRCFVTTQIAQTCRQLTHSFSNGRFQLSELLSITFTDSSPKQPLSPSSAYQPHTAHILRSFDPAKSGLSSWTSRLIERDPEVENFLLECGIYRRSDWTILKDTKPGGLRKNLSAAAARRRASPGSAVAQSLPEHLQRRPDQPQPDRAEMSGSYR